MSTNLQSDALLSAQLSVRYGEKPPVLRDVQFAIRRGEVLGLVGQSGSGKSTIAMAILGLLDRKSTNAEGTVEFDGIDLLTLRERELRGLRGRKIALVLQSPLSSLNPALKIRTQLKEAWRAHASGPEVDCDNAIRTALESVSLPSSDDFLRKYPAQMSVGQAQRVLIAMAVMHRPALLIADEATSALDVITQAEILSPVSRIEPKFRNVDSLHLARSGIRGRNLRPHCDSARRPDRRDWNGGAGLNQSSPPIHSAPDGGDAQDAAETRVAAKAAAL